MGEQADLALDQAYDDWGAGRGYAPKLSKTSKRVKPAALKPCPFCGSSDVRHVTVKEDWGDGWSIPVTRIICRDCRATGPCCSTHPRRIRATEKWNTRKDSNED